MLINKYKHLGGGIETPPQSQYATSFLQDSVSVIRYATSFTLRLAVADVSE